MFFLLLSHFLCLWWVFMKNHITHHVGCDKHHYKPFIVPFFIFMGEYSWETMVHHVGCDKHYCNPFIVSFSMFMDEYSWKTTIHITLGVINITTSLLLSHFPCLWVNIEKPWYITLGVINTITSPNRRYEWNCCNTIWLWLITLGTWGRTRRTYVAWLTSEQSWASPNKKKPKPIFYNHGVLFYPGNRNCVFFFLALSLFLINNLLHKTYMVRN
jgi:hypothetical protein